jgi:hypothetical protein
MPDDKEEKWRDGRGTFGRGVEGEEETPERIASSFLFLACDDPYVHVQ